MSRLHWVLGSIVLLVGVLASQAEMRPALAAPNAIAPLYAGDEALVAFAPGTAPDVARRIVQDAGAELVEAYSLTGVYRICLAEGHVDAALARLRGHPAVRAADPNYRVQLSARIPNDPRYEEQADYWTLLGAPDAWDISTGRASVVVALIDGAVDLDHPDLVGRIWTNADEIPANGLDDDDNGYVDDVHGYDFVGAFPGGDGVPDEDSDPDVRPGDSAAGDGIDQDGDGIADGAVGHGTRVAGIIAATGDNGTGVVGTAWGVRLMPLRVTTPEGDGYFSSFIRALEYAIANGAQVVNISLASAFLPETVRLAVDAALDAGLILVAAAGNGGVSVAFPGALPGVIAVGSHGDADNAGTREAFSPRAPGVEVVAPGVSVLTTDVTAGTATAGYAAVTGTSFSAPYVSGAAALVLSIRPGTSREEFLTLLRDSAEDLPDDGAPQWDGSGRLHLGRLVTAAAALPPAPPVIDSVMMTDVEIHVAGRAAPSSAVTVSDRDSSALAISPLEGAATADADGAFILTIPIRAVPETAARLEFVAIAEGISGRSAPSRGVWLSLLRRVQLSPGWNLVSWAGSPVSSDELLASLPPGADRILAWSDNGWRTALRGNPVLRIDQVQSGDGLWIFVEGSQDALWTYARDALPDRALAPGWHLVAWAGASQEVTAAVIRSGLPVEAVFAWDPAQNAFRSYHPAVSPLLTPAASRIDQLAHLDAIWMLVGEPGGMWTAGR